MMIPDIHRLWTYLDTAIYAWLYLQYLKLTMGPNNQLFHAFCPEAEEI